MGRICSDELRLIVKLPCILYVLLYTQVTWTSTEADSKCPVYNDVRWKTKNSVCKGGESYHCQDNIDGMLAFEGCFPVKTCRKGSRPVIENGLVVCLDCPPGSYQSDNELRSNEHVYTTCWPHGVCLPKYGKSECLPGSRENDIKCRCSEHHTPSPESCSCFTNNDGCECKFHGCPNGTVLRDGNCTSETISVASPTVATTQVSTAPAETASGNSGLTAGIVVAAVIVVAAGIVALGLILHRCRKKRRGNAQELHSANGHIPDASESAEPLVNGGLPNGHATSSSGTDALFQTDEQTGKSIQIIKQVFNIGKVHTLTILPTTAENRNVDQDESPDENPHWSPHETIFGSASDVCREGPFKSREGGEEQFHPSSQDILGMDPSADTDAAPVIGTGERVVVQDDDETIPKVVDVPGSFGETCETIPKAFLSSTNIQPCGNQETQDLEEPEEADRLLQGFERSEDEVSIRTNVPVSINKRRDETEHDVDIRLHPLIT